MKEILGKKLGMTQVFAPNGLIIPVTVIEAGPCSILQKKTVEKDGYEALKVAFLNTRENLKTKAELGEFKKANVEAKKVVAEIKLDDMASKEVGAEVKCDIFNEGEKVDISG
ncbi:MAG: 50S ribosomal protein L3, partial [Christensenellales bacterium]